jgi:hypothetical protein
MKIIVNNMKNSFERLSKKIREIFVGTLKHTAQNEGKTS